MVNKFDCIHSNAFHMKTVMNPSTDCKDELSKIKKVVNFNNNLPKIYTVHDLITNILQIKIQIIKHKLICSLTKVLN